MIIYFSFMERLNLDKSIYVHDTTYLFGRDHLGGEKKNDTPQALLIYLGGSA